MNKQKILGEVIHDALSMKEAEEKIKKAIEFYKETQFVEPDKIFKGIFKFPRIIMPDGKIIDIEKEYEKGKVISVAIGVVPFIVYLSNKGGEMNIFYHEFEPYQCFLAVDPDDPTRIHLVFTKETKFDERGIL
jgi:hypothetical protein